MEENKQLFAAMAALGSEIMALAVYGMQEGKDHEMLLRALADVSAQNMVLQHEVGITNDEFTKAFSDRLDDIYPKPPVEEDEDNAEL